MKKNGNVFVIFLSTVCFMFGVAGSRPLITLLSKELGATNAEIGVIVAVFSFLPLFLSLPVGVLIDKIGPGKPLVCSVGVGAIGLLWPYLLNTLSSVYVSQVLTGVSQMTFVLAMQAIAAQPGKNKTREHLVFIFSIGMAVSTFAGPLFSGILSDQKGYAITFFVLGISTFVSIFFVFFLRLHTDTAKDMPGMTGDKSVGELLKVPQLRHAFFISALFLIGKDMYLAYFPLLAADKGLSNAWVGIIIAANAGAGVLIRFFLPPIAVRWNRKTVISFCVMVIGLLYIIHPLLDHAAILLIVSFILGIHLGIGQPFSITATMDALSFSQQGKGLGLRLTINKSAQVIVPTFLGLAASVVGMAGVFYIIGGLILTGSWTRNKKV